MHFPLHALYSFLLHLLKPNVYKDSGVLTLPSATNQACIFNDGEIIQKLPQSGGVTQKKEIVDF